MDINWQKPDVTGYIHIYAQENQLINLIWFYWCCILLMICGSKLEERDASGCVITELLFDLDIIKQRSSICL